MEEGGRASVILAVASLLVAGSAAPAQDREGPRRPGGPPAEAAAPERSTRGVDRALEYLAAKQRPDGGWHNNHAVNALALLAFLGRGHTPGRGPYRDVVARGKRFLLASASPRGYLSFSTMYEHGLATLALAEMYGMDADPALEGALRKAVDLIVKAQAPNGGWRYQPAPIDHDLSVTVMQVVALRAARNAEVPVPERTIERAAAYVRSCADPAGGFAYQPGQAAGPQTTAAGVLCLQLLGKHDDPAIPGALDLMAGQPVAWGARPPYFYYFHYYAIQTNYQAGGRRWDDWHPRVRELLLAHQGADGSWDAPPGGQEVSEAIVGPNKVYATAMASLVLEVYLHYLPAYQR